MKLHYSEIYGSSILPGEDMWLCMLLIKQGHRVDYCSISDALTYAPEGFNEFFKQRRRWISSTFANVIDLLVNWRKLTKKNEDISTAFMLYLVN